jgi:hypothetical protein
MIMFDTISSYSYNSMIDFQDMENVKEIFNPSTREFIKLTGYNRNLNIQQNNNTTYIRGSLCKFYFGNNFETLNRTTTKQAIEKLSDSLKILPKKFNIYRLDIGGNLFMTEPITSYTNLFSDLKRYNKSFFKNSLYFTNQLKQLIFYDKIAELKYKKIDTGGYEPNLLRYEARFKKRLKNLYGQKEITYNDLYIERFYEKSIKLWQDLYFGINKLTKLKIKEMNLTAKQGKDYLLLKFINDTGGIDEAIKFIEVNENNFTTKREYLRAKSSIKELIKNKKMTESNELIQELDLKIKNAVIEYS